MSVEKINKKNVLDVFSLTPLQKGILFHVISGEKQLYINQLHLEIKGKINIEAFSNSINCLISNNELLRAIIRWEGIKTPVQIVLKDNKESFKYFDLTSVSDKNVQQEKISELKDRDINFDLTGFLYRITLCQIEPENFQLIISNHHILFDGWSNSIILNEIFENYSRILNNTPVKCIEKMSFKSFCNEISKIDHKACKLFWKKYFNEFKGGGIINSNERSNCNKPFATYRVSFNEQEKNKLSNFIADNKVTLAATVYGAWGKIIQLYNNLEDVVFGTTVSGRNNLSKGLNSAVGLFINTLPLRIRTSPNQNIISVLKNISSDIVLRTEYENSSLADILNWINEKSNEVFFNSIIVIENYPIDVDSMFNELNLSFSKISFSETNHYDITLTVNLHKEIEFIFSYNNKKFNQFKIAEISEYFLRALNYFIENPQSKWSEVNLLSQPEEDKLIKGFNNTVKEYPKEKTIPELFEQQAMKSATKTAITFKDNSISYKELSKKVDLLASILLQNGVQSGDVVGILIQRSIDMIIALLATLKAGAAYLPMDPLYPVERIKYMLDDSEAKLVLTGSGVSDLFEEISYTGKVLNISAPLAVCPEPKVNTNLVSTPESVAYVIYTSGSTGRPKGVMVSHRNVVNFVEGMSESLELNPSETVLALTTISFDIFVLETIVPLLKGMRVVMAGKTEQLDIERLKSTIIKKSVDVLQVTPSRLRLLVENDPKLQLLQSIKKLFVGGESFSDNLFKEVKSVYSQRIFNLYGPTETTVWSTVKELTGEDKVTIGKPIANTNIYILDKNDALQPIGMVGELYIAGDGVSQGYFKNTELTEKKFVGSPFHKSETIYRTGDVASWLPNGELECFGRLDDQVKIRGYRIEMGEIESVLTKYSPIKGAVVSAGGDESTGSKYLCGYYVADHELAYNDLSDFLIKSGLPEYMVPSYFVYLPEIPLTQNRKVNKNALPKPEIAKKEDFVAPTTKTEKQMAAIWSEVLNIGEDRISINSNFFELGGNSFNATVLMSQIKKEFNLEIPIVNIFKLQTIQKISDYIDTHEWILSDKRGLNRENKKQIVI